MVEPLNLFLRAFAQSTIRGQCSPDAFALLAPTYESLVDSYDRDSKSWYADSVRTEEFIASHVIRIPTEQPPLPAKDVGFAKNRPRQFYTVNGRVVIIKDSHAFAAKGFKSANQVLIVADGLWYQDGSKQDPWPVIYINAPLVGTWAPRSAQIGTLSGYTDSRSTADDEDKTPSPTEGNDFSIKGTPHQGLHGKKNITSFVGLLEDFPQIERQLRPQLDKIFQDLREECDRLTAPSDISEIPRKLKRTATASSDVSTSSTLSRPVSSLSLRSDFGEQIIVLEMTKEEEFLQSAMDRAMRDVIGAFQQLDKALLNELSSSSDIEGRAIDAMIERFIYERVHNLYLFEKICLARKKDELVMDLRRLQHVDAAQVGVEVEETRDAVVDLSKRLSRGVLEFEKMSSAGSPHEMLQILAQTLKIITTSTSHDATSVSSLDGTVSAPEKEDSTMKYNADMLVSLLLVVVIRSNVRHLKASLSYMRHFIFSEEVETGVNGYALSTFEVVISYISRESRSLAEVSRRNRKIVRAIREGNKGLVRQLLISGVLDDDASHQLSADNMSLHEINANGDGEALSEQHVVTNGTSEPNGNRLPNGTAPSEQEPPFPDATPLSFDAVLPRPPKLNTRRISFEAESVVSWSADSNGTDPFSPGRFEDRMSMYPALDIDHMVRIRLTDATSLPRIAIEAQQKEVLELLLTEVDYWRNPRHLLEDCDDSYETLMMAALKSGATAIIDYLVDRLHHGDIDADARKKYLTLRDASQRTVGHYLYEHRSLIMTIGKDIDWQQKDVVGRTPLVAICRSYDTNGYRQMVGDAIAAATEAQGDGPLRLEDHVDNKGNSLLHLLSNPQLIRKVLAECLCDVNCLNAKQWTPLISAAKYGRLDVIRVLFADPRLNPFFKDASGLMAVEQAKSEGVRSLIDDLTLLRLPPSPDGRMTGIVRVATDRSGSTTLLVKHTVQPPSSNSVTICSCWRTLEDFRQLAACLKAEHPSSWLPMLRVHPVYSPATIACRTWIREESTRWINTILSHPTFTHHELVWEFFVLPELDWTTLSERSRRKAETRAERVREEMVPVEEPTEIQQVIQASQWHISEVESGVNGALRWSRALEQSAADVHVAICHLGASLSTLLAYHPLPTKESPTPAPATIQSHTSALAKSARLFAPPESSPQQLFSADLAALANATTALNFALTRIPSLVASVAVISATGERHLAASRRPDRLVPRGFLAETRARIKRDSERKAQLEFGRAETLSKEIAAARETVVPEMAAQQDWRGRETRAAIRRLATRSLGIERGRLVGLESALHAVRRQQQQEQQQQQQH